MQVFNDLLLATPRSGSSKGPTNRSGVAPTHEVRRGCKATRGRELPETAKPSRAPGATAGLPSRVLRGRGDGSSMTHSAGSWAEPEFGHGHHAHLRWFGALGPPAAGGQRVT